MRVLLDDTRVVVFRAVVLRIYPHIEAAREVACGTAERTNRWRAAQLLTVNGRLQFLAIDRPHATRNAIGLDRLSLSLPHARASPVELYSNFLRLYEYARARARAGEQKERERENTRVE